jgi:hypothetical protein
LVLPASVLPAWLRLGPFNLLQLHRNTRELLALPRIAAVYSK